jgi:hypothetical protein
MFQFFNLIFSVLGILNLSGVYGFVFYMVLCIPLNLLLWKKTKFDHKSYFKTAGQLFWDGVLGGMLVSFHSFFFHFSCTTPLMASSFAIVSTAQQRINKCTFPPFPLFWHSLTFCFGPWLPLLVIDTVSGMRTDFVETFIASDHF